MRKKETRELRGKSLEELKKQTEDLRVDIAKTRVELKANPPKDTNVMMKKRKRLARILTIIREKKLAEEVLDVKDEALGEK